MQAQLAGNQHKVAEEVLDALVDGLRSGEIPLEAARQIARETLATIKKIDEHEESILKFYESLASKHKIFNILYTRVKDQILKKRELTLHRQALSAIDEGKFDEAYSIADSAIKATANETA